MQQNGGVGRNILGRCAPSTMQAQWLRLRTTLRTRALLFTMTAAFMLAAGSQGCARERQEAPPALSVQVESGLLPILRQLQDRLLDEQHRLEIDGVPVFESDDKFLPGKIAIASAEVVVRARSDSERASALRKFQDLTTLTLGMRNESWGIYYYLSALQKLNEAGLFPGALDARTVAHLRETLDWRTFVDPSDFSTKLPTNYYGVAFSIARLRHLLGWEEEATSDILLERTLEHYRRHSRPYGFSDETEGEGRFDRYSVLLIAELAHRFRSTHLELTPEMRRWLRNSAEFVLVNLNSAGTGFQFGRSIGAYGDTAFLEILSISAWAGVLNAQEQELAYAFSQRTFRRYLSFWHDAGMGSVNLWENGRRTDGYRGKHRILGENFSLIHQLLETAQIWDDLGYADQVIDDDRLEEHLARLPPVTLTRFADGEYARAALTVRDKGHVFSLWFVNGARNLYDTIPYYPAPFSSGLVESAANASWPQLVPRITFADGSVSMPLVFYKDLELKPQPDGYALSYRMPYLASAGSTDPAPDERVSVDTEIIFRAGKITRRDRFRLLRPAEWESIEVEFAVPASLRANRAETFNFRTDGPITFVAHGFETCTIKDVSLDAVYRSPERRLQSSAVCSLPRRDESTTNTGWDLHY